MRVFKTFEKVERAIFGSKRGGICKVDEARSRSCRGSCGKKQLSAWRTNEREGRHIVGEVVSMNIASASAGAPRVLVVGMVEEGKCSD